MKKACQLSWRMSLVSIPSRSMYAFLRLSPVCDRFENYLYEYEGRQIPLCTEYPVGLISLIWQRSQLTYTVISVRLSCIAKWNSCLMGASIKKCWFLPLRQPGIQLKLKLICDRQSVGQSLLVSGAHLGPVTNISFSLKFPSESCVFVIL
jgi:hypothetical protein